MRPGFTKTRGYATREKTCQVIVRGHKRKLIFNCRKDVKYLLQGQKGVETIAFEINLLMLFLSIFFPDTLGSYIYPIFTKKAFTSTYKNEDPFLHLFLHNSPIFWRALGTINIFLFVANKRCSLLFQFVILSQFGCFASTL